MWGLPIKNVSQIFKLLEQADMPKSEFVLYMNSTLKGNPFLVLIGCLLSLRTKDETTYPASVRLFKLAKTPQEMLRLDKKTIEAAIYPVGFYKTKAESILAISKSIIKDFNGKVPNSIEELIKLKGVGRKTANLTMTKGFNKPAICVDIHVHRISNRLGWLKTETPDETELQLRELLAESYWDIINEIFVTFGQNICLPRNPKCENCPIIDYCNND